jgi:hypothetical protein
VVVAVIAVRVVQMAADTVVDMIAVRNRLMAASGAVDMTCVVAAAAMVGGAVVRVVARHFDHMLVDMSFVRMVEMTVMEIIDVPAVAHRRVAAARPMLVGMLGML